MLRRYSVDRDPPREIDNIPLNGGLSLILNMGFIFIILGATLASTAAIPPFTPVLTGAKLGFGLVGVGVGYYIYQGGRKKLNERKDALKNGFIIEGKVIDKGRKFNPFSSWKYYTVTIRFEDGEHKLVATNESIHDYFDVGDMAEGFRNPETGSVFFPPVAGIRIDILTD